MLFTQHRKSLHGSYTSGGSTSRVSMWCDLQNTFDFMKHLVLQKRQFEVGINGKLGGCLRTAIRKAAAMWKSMVNLLKLERGVRQDSVLSPSLFLLVTDPLLRQLESSRLGCPSITTTWGASCTQMASESCRVSAGASGLGEDVYGEKLPQN